MKKDGKVVATVSQVVSKDGSVMTFTVTGTNARQQSIHNVQVYDKQQSSGPDQRRISISVTRIYTGPDGQTGAEEIDVKVTPWAGHDGYEQSDTVKASSLRFVRRPPGWAEGWHHAVQRQYITTLSGPGSYLDFAGLSFHVPTEPALIWGNAACGRAAMRPNANRKITTCARNEALVNVMRPDWMPNLALLSRTVHHSPEFEFSAPILRFVAVCGL
jgi:hypothetical protein